VTLVNLDPQFRPRSMLSRPGHTGTPSGQSVQKHILVVEDDDIPGAVLAEVLADRRYSVAIARTGRDALTRMQERVPDLLLLDLMLPDIDGWTFLRLRAVMLPWWAHRSWSDLAPRRLA
jgi:PleD family two-component response regulator